MDLVPFVCRAALRVVDLALVPDLLGVLPAHVGICSVDCSVLLLVAGGLGYATWRLVPAAHAVGRSALERPIWKQAPRESIKWQITQLLEFNDVPQEPELRVAAEGGDS